MMLRSSGRGFLDTPRPGATAQERLIAELRRRGARPRDLESLAQSAFPDLSLPEALRKFGQDVERAAQPRHCDLFDTPYDPNWKDNDR